MRVQVLGPVRAWHSTEEVALGPTGQRAVLGLLALSCGRPLSRGDLVDALWGDRPPSTAVNVIQTRVKHLRRLLEPGRRPHTKSAVLPQLGDGYALRVAAGELDLVGFRDLVDRANGARHAGDLAGAADLLSTALRMWEGRPLADVPFLATHPKVVALAEERFTAVARYGELMIATGAAAEALPVLEEAAVDHPLDEAAQARLIRAYQAAGRRAQAFSTYQEARRRLVDELGVDPGPELNSAHSTLLRNSGGPAVVTIPDRVRTPPAQLPADVPGFTSRAGELSTLDRLLAEGAPGTVVATISGTAGVGKTALAIRWGHRVRDRFPDGQLYVNLRGYDPDQPMSPGEALVSFLGALGVPDHEIPLELEDRASRFRTEISGRRMLVLLDNAGSVEQVRPLLPGTPHCAVVVTSRDSLAGLVALHGAHRIDLDLLPMEDAVALLGTLIDTRVATEPKAAELLAERCVRLPLALRVAAELAISRPAARLSELAGELADRGRRLELLDAGGDQRAAVRAVFSWSYQHLPPDAARAFRLFGLHPGADLDPFAAAALLRGTLDEAVRLLGILRRAHLSQATSPGRHGMHDLLRAYAIQLAQAEEPEADRRAALTRLLDHYLGTATAAIDLLHPAELEHRPEAGEPETPRPPLPGPAEAHAWLDAELPTLTIVCGYAADHGWPGHTSRLAATLFHYLDGGSYPNALLIHGHALRAARDRTERAQALSHLGTVFWRLGRYPAAATHLRQALALFRELGDRVGEAHALSNIGIIDERLGNYQPAAENQQRALALYSKTGDRVGAARALSNLGIIEERQGHYLSAAERLQQGRTLCRDTGYRAGEAYTLLNLGYVSMRLGHHLSAAGHFQQALTLFQELGERRGEAYALTNLGDVDERQGHYPAAIEHHVRALELFRELGERRGEAHALNGLGEALYGTGQAVDARAQHAAALKVAIGTGDSDDQAGAHTGLAKGYRATGDLGRARYHWERALALYTKLDDPEAGNIRAHLRSL
ncbi:AfsR/SARP family transcriptional regulator [Amycolatopsis nigrescens]|uniref:AfsR/SARP family transcriptional regulator n=1 Tax=Amycolatopsis nigrescens TaxID=381445 RepID=UPI00035E0AAA|nr:tetratricopeptide repeat protein [Amycolatopsis nigrescens]